MGISETILAAMIGAIATVSTALFQLFQALRNNKNDSRPKRGSPLRSFLAVLMLMVASAGGGFLYSELLKERTSHDMQAMRDELNGKLQLLATATEKLATRDMPRADDKQPSSIASSSVVSGAMASMSAMPVSTASATSTDSSIYAPACNVSGGCTDATRQSMLLCSAIPSNTQVKKAEFFLRGAQQPASAETQVALEQEFSGAKFTGTYAEQPSEEPQGSNRKTVCVNLLHWSDQPHIARMVLYYGASSAEENSAVKPLTIATQSLMPSAHAATLTSSAVTR